MPIKRGIDKFGSFYRYGFMGKKYYYLSNDKRSRDMAKRKAQAQERAIYATGYKE